MKKAQILSALALAFALGVTPVIATVNTASAFTVADTKAKPAVQGSATQADVNSAIAAVEANLTYKNMIILKDVTKAYSEGDYADLAAVSGATTKSQDAANILNTLGSSFGLASADAAEIYKEKSFTTQIEKAVAEAEKTEYFDVLSQIFAAINANDGKGDDTAYRAALQNYNNYFSAYNVKFNADANVTIKTAGSTPADVQANFDTIVKWTGAYNDYKTLWGYVNTAEENVEAYETGKTDILNALENAGVLNQNGLVELAKELKKDNVSLNALMSIANAYNNNYAGWMALDTKVEAAKKGVINLDSKSNYDLIIAMAQALKSAEYNTTQTPEEIAQTLVGYKAPAEEVTTSTIKSEDGIVTITGNFDASKTFVKSTASDKKVSAFGDDKYAMYDINLVDGDGNKVTVEGSVTVSIKVPSNLDGAKSSIYYVNEDGKVEKLAARYENGNMVFTVSHFSLYAIVEDNGKNLGITAPTTGAIANTDGSASTTVAMVAGIATALTAAGAGVVAYRNARRANRK